MIGGGWSPSRRVSGFRVGALGLAPAVLQSARRADRACRHPAHTLRRATGVGEPIRKGRKERAPSRPVPPRSPGLPVSGSGRSPIRLPDLLSSAIQDSRFSLAADLGVHHIKRKAGHLPGLLPRQRDPPDLAMEFVFLIQTECRITCDM